MMTKGVALIVVAVFAATPVAARAGATDLILINNTTSAMGAVSMRRFRTGAWQSLSISPRPGGRIAVPVNDENCAFDIRADLAGKETVIWSGVNLCEARTVILNRHDSGAAWVDYE